MKKEKLHIVKLLFAAVLFLSLSGNIWAEISDINITDFQVSYGIDEVKNKPVGVTETVKQGTKKIYASAIIHNIFPPTEFQVKWYRYDHQKEEELYRYKMKVSGTEFVYSAIVVPGDASLPGGEYGVDIIAGGKVLKHIAFRVEEAERTQKSIVPKPCIKPTAADNRLLIEDEVKLFPKVKPELSSLRLRRFHDSKKRFSLLAPSGWKASKALPNNVFLQLSSSKKGEIAEYILRELPVDASLKKKYGAEDILKAVSKVLVDEAEENGVKTVMKPKIFAFPDMLFSNFMLLHEKGKEKLFELHSVIYDGNYMYDVVLLTDENGFEVSKFLSSLASYSFWTGESCK